MEPSDKRSSPPRPVNPHAAYLRERRLLTEIPLERVAHVADVSPALVSLLERGYRRLTPAHFKTLHGALEYLARTEAKRPGSPTIFSVTADKLLELPWLCLLNAEAAEASGRKSGVGKGRQGMAPAAVLPPAIPPGPADQPAQQSTSAPAPTVP